ncbi:hypothetical protein BJX62DRAFT_239315 [Aspergillus germanicus]
MTSWLFVRKSTSCMPNYCSPGPRGRKPNAHGLNQIIELIGQSDYEDDPTNLRLLHRVDLLHPHRASIFISSLYKMAPSTLLLSLLPLALSVAAASQASSSQGCFSNPGDLQNVGSYVFQSIGHCTNACIESGYRYVAVQGEDCWCGKSLPSTDDVVSDDQCDTVCPGYVGDVCGGEDAWSVYEIGELEPSAWLSSLTDSTTSTATQSTITVSDSASESTASTTSTSSTSSTSLITSTDSPEASTAVVPSSSAALETTSSSSTSIEPTFTGNSANRRYSFLF